ncbi:MAG TPA: polysaccharide biosynthesis tyrosine autokinase, partial [Edaphobacter sp.]|nr:polysaccharide biosynthesis tyrosine autokinase [Edaphobacter sp.]
LQTSEDALQAYARQNQLIFTDQEDDTNVATEKLKQLQQELSTATGDRIAKQSRFELAKSSPPEALADVLHDENLEESRSKVEDKRRQIADLSAVFNPEYTKLKRVQAELTALEATYDNGRTNMLKSIENDYQQAISKEALLLAAYNAQTAEVTALSQKQIQYNILKRELDSNRQLYDTMLQQTKQASLASAMRASNVRVVDPAEIPTIPVFPNFKLNSAIGLFVGLLLSTVIVILRERADRTLQQPSDIKLWTDLAELGTIPRASTGIEATYGKYGASLPGAKRDRALRPRNQPRPVELITSEYKSSVIAEAFRSVLTSLLFVGENGSRPRVIVFTSSSPSDGKTTVVSNLAIATAEIRRKILVIDADLRRPRMHSIFNLPNDRGLTDLLSEDFSERSLTSLIHRTNIEGLDVLPGGPPAQAAAHLLHSPNFAAMLSMLRKEYDMILIDTPPMYQMTDARVAGRLADAVVLVARAGQTTRDSLLVIKDRFVEDRIRVLGAILNDWDPKRSPNGHYSRQYGRYYGRSVPENVQNN